MNQEKSGKFIALCRREKGLTQMQLAEMLNITDRAVSKWETGRAMPDTSIMLDLCKILGISVNELLSGERLNMNKYNEKAEENLLDIAKQEEKSNKRLFFYEKVIGFMGLISFLIMIFTAIFMQESLYLKIFLFVSGFVILITGVAFALKIETEAGYYECENCHYRYVPKYKSVFFAMHLGTTRYMKCPECKKRSWNKKYMKK